MQNSRTAKKEGAAIVESCLAIIMLCLILFGLLQVSYLIMARDVISFTAFASARALAVGMSAEFVERVAHVTTIPTAGPSYNSGRMDNDSLGDPGTVGARWDLAVATTPGSDQFWYEHTIIPYYLGADDESDLDGLLNYYYWITSDTEVAVQSSAAGSEKAEVTVSQNVPLAFPFAAVFFYDADKAMVLSGSGTYEEVPVYEIEQSFYMENHSALYLTTE
jgi:hypothetical protein